MQNVQGTFVNMILQLTHIIIHHYLTHHQDIKEWAAVLVAGTQYIILIFMIP
jgi:hypothetical protein